MSVKILIDTNIYLRFYDQKSSGFKNLIENMDKIKNTIFITNQIYNEVLRNKLEIAIRSIKDIGKHFNIKDAKFPEGFKETEVIEWNNEIENISRNENKLNLLGKKVIEMVSNGTDTVSKTLDPIFKNAVLPSPEQILRAKERKEFGNPPGKNQDPIGDQITWIQFLDAIEKGDRLFIISNDQDYLESYSENDIYLNPFLAKELENKQISRNNVLCFKTLISGLTEIKKVNPDLLIPGKETIDEIEKEELIPLPYLGQSINIIATASSTSAYGATSGCSGYSGPAGYGGGTGIGYGVVPPNQRYNP